MRREPLGYRPALDGVRAVAILLVVLHHTAALLVPGTARVLMPAGFLGVDVFFVLSGFLITTLLLERRRQEPRPLRTFYLRRGLRLLPAVIVLLAANLAYALAHGAGVGDAARSVPAVLTYTTNWVELHHVLGGGVSPEVSHLWSLAIEEQFYLVWPLALFGLILCGASRRILLAVALVGVVVVAARRAELWGQGVGWLRIYLRTDARADELLLGVALALVPVPLATRPRLRAIVTVVALLALVAAAELLQPDAAALYLGGFTAVGLVAVGLIAASLEPAGPAGRLLASRPAVWLGRLSYSLYLWHFGVFQVVALHTRSDSPIVRVALGWALALAAAVASLYLVERRFLILKARLGGQSRRRSAQQGPPLPAVVDPKPG